MSSSPSGAGRFSPPSRAADPRVWQHDLGRELAAGLLTLVVASTLLRAHPVLVGLVSLGAGLSKETSYPFVLALAVIGLLLARRRTGRPIRPHVVAVVAGLVLAVLVASALNLIRFGSPRNTHYLDDDFRTPTVGRMLEFAAGLFISPNGGIVPFWPIASVLVALLLAIPIVCTIRSRAAVRETWPALALAALIAALVLGFALWWVPFGWVAWGPRLSLPWVLPILLLALVAFARLLRPLVARAVGSALALSFTCGTTVVLTPHVGLLWRYETSP